MKVSGRARLAWANRNIEAAADIIVADYLRSIAHLRPFKHGADDVLCELANELDPKEEN